MNVPLSVEDASMRIPAYQYVPILVLVVGLSASSCGSIQKMKGSAEPTSSEWLDTKGTDQSERDNLYAPTPHLSEGLLSEDVAKQTMYDLSHGTVPEARKAIALIEGENDTRFISVFIELMRAGQIGIVTGAGYNAYLVALENLSGKNFGNDWPLWVEWYGSTDLVPPPGFTGWKGKLLGRIDSGFSSFLPDGALSTIRVEEIQWGGVVVDGIPALDDPKMIPADDADYLKSREPVFGISLNGDNRAYPLRILDWHEMANDIVGGVPVTLAYCTLCGAAIAYDGRAPNGRTYTFGSSGFLFRSNKLMYDRQTRTLWNQLTGRPVLGDLVGNDLELKILPVVLTTWEQWLGRHPDTVVLSLDTGHRRNYVPGAAYGHYFSNDTTMFPVWQRSGLLPDKSRIFALRVEDIPKAYPVDRLLSERVVNDTIGSTPIVLAAFGNEVEVEGTSQRAGKVRYSSGAEVRAYERRNAVFKEGQDSNTLVDEVGDKWIITEDALIGPEGRRLDRLGGHLAYWFGWYSFFPFTLVYGKTNL
jgi:hypothetical protein